MDSTKNPYRFFPHKNYRPHQLEGMERIRACAKNGLPLIYNSPTGTGKTAMVLGGVLDAMGEGEKMAVITRTHSQYRIFAEEFLRVKKNNPKLKFGLLVGRSNVCPMNAGHVECGILRKNSAAEIRKGENPWYPRSSIQSYRSSLRAKNPLCPYYANCFQRNAARPLYNKEAMQIIEAQMDSPKTPEEFRKACTENPYPKCPYELLKATLCKADVVILHYQYLLDPDVRNAVLSANWLGAGPEDIHLVVDEAHNLAPYIQDIASLECTKKDVEDAIKLLRDGRLDDVKYSLKGLGEHITALTLLLSDFGLFLEQYLAKKNPDEIIGEGSEDVVSAKEMYRPNEETLPFLEDASGQVLRQFESKKLGQDIPEEMPLPGICRVSAILRQAVDSNSGRHIRTLSIKPVSGTVGRRLDGGISFGDYAISLKIADIDPRDAVRYLAESFRSLTLVSGTLSPTKLYRKLLFHDGIDAEEISIPYPFPKENRLVLCCRDVSSQRRLRETESNIDSVKECIRALFSVKGNVAVFFTGYDMKRQYLAFCQELSLQLEKTLMDEARNIDKARFIDEYKKHGNAALLGVCKGSFSEGVDYIGEAMNAVAVIGLPLAPWNTKQQMINRYYESVFGPGIGKTIAYDLPAVTAAIQAAGRCIRSQDDTGVIILADSRYANSTEMGVKRILPDWMAQEMQTLNACELSAPIKQKAEEWNARPRPEKNAEPKKTPEAILPTDELMIKLEEWRLQKARDEQVEPYRIMSNATLEALARERPQTVEDLDMLKGFGPHRTQEYGQDLISMIKNSKPLERERRIARSEEETAEIIIATIKETGERYGANKIAEILAGSKSRNVREHALERLENYGSLTDLTQEAIEAKIKGLLRKRRIYRTMGLYPALKIRK